MLNRLFLASTRFQRFMIAVGLVAFASAAPADAALKKYDIRLKQLLHYLQTSPQAEYRTTPDRGVSVIDDSGANPVLVKYITATNGGATTIVPQLAGFIHFRNSNSQGPENNLPGTGSTASSINWGNVTGYTITGGTFCHAVPSAICTLAAAVETATISAILRSTNYDFGTWVFHGTGFSHQSGGYVQQTGPTAPGNIQLGVIGSQNQDGTVPALPLLGIGTVGLSLASLAVAAVRRSRRS